jgi:hypothetical protein
MALSTSEVDFGTVAADEQATETVELSNPGSYPLGITSVEIGGGSPDFSVEVGDADCARTVEGSKREPVIDTGSVYIPGDTGTWETVSVPVLVLDPGCVVPLTVTYTPSRPVSAQDALVVWSDPEVSPPTTSGDPAFLPDWLHFWRVVWLTGATDLVEDTADPERDTAGRPVDPIRFGIVGDIVDASQTSLTEGESVDLEVRLHDADGDGTYAWSTDAAGTFSDQLGALTTYTAAPDALPGCSPTAGRYDNIYIVVQDARGRQDWSFPRLAVWDGSAPLYCPTEPPPCPAEDAATCGCGAGCGDGGAAGLFVLVAAAGTWRRGRGSPPRRAATPGSG